MRRKWVRWLTRIITVLVALVALAAGVLLMIEWRPEQLEPTSIGSGAQAKTGLPPTSSLRLISWNLGFAGQDAAADFFMDGGKRVRPTDRAQVDRNLAAITTWLQNRPADLIMLQEVDWDSSRTWGMDQVAHLTESLPTKHWTRAANFKVAWIPYPFTDPLGRVESGLLSLSAAKPHLAIRHQLPGDYPWPVRVFHLKRCLHELRFKAPDGHDWVVLHMHLSAFDKAGQLRTQQMAYLKRLMQKFYAEGDHVIVIGDWNHAPPELQDGHFGDFGPDPFWFQRVPADWTPTGWHWAWDPKTPSLRTLSEPYRPGQTFVTSVDAALVSPEIEILSVRCDNQAFALSDHHPLQIEVALRMQSDR